MASYPQKIIEKEDKEIISPGYAIVNAYTLIAQLYCLLSALLFYAFVRNIFLALVHGLAFITITVNYIILQRSGNYPRFTTIILVTGTIVVLSLFATGGWENTGFLWPFAYLPFVFFLSSGKNALYWAIALFAGCILLAVLDLLQFITVPYSAVGLLNYFAALLVFLICLYFFRQASKNTEDALRESEAKIQTLFGAAPDAVIVIDQAGLIVQWNPKAETLFGWKAGEVMNQLLSNTIIPHRYREAHQKGLTHFLQTGTGPVLDTTIELKALRKNNTELDVALSISPTRVKDKYFFVGFIRDITAQKKTEEEIRHLNTTLEQRVIERTNELHISEEKYRHLFQSNPMPMWVIELPSFNFLSVNNAAIRHYGYSAEEFMNMTALDIRPPEDRESFTRLNRTAGTGTYYTGRWKHRKKNGMIITVEISSDEIEYEGKRARIILSNDITEKTKNEESRALYASIINSTDDAILSKTLEGVITSWNRGAEVLFGYSRAEVIGRHISLLTPSNRQNEEQEIIDKIKEGNFIEHYETERVRKDGRVIYVSLTVSPLRDSNEKIVGASNIGRNITERKLAEEKLQRSLKDISDYKYALDESSILAITDQKGIIRHVNNNFCKISKYTEAELIGQDHRIINSGYHSPVFIRNLWVTIANGKIWKGELKNKAKDGTYYWVDTTIVPFLDKLGKPYQYVAIRADITERKLAEESLRKSLKETTDYKYALDESCIVAITDQKGIIKYTNNKFCKISKYSEAELIGQDHRIINSGYHSAAFIRNLWVTIANGNIWRGELKNKAKDNSYYWVDTTIVPFLDEHGKPYQYVAIRADITERKKAEQEIISLNETLEKKIIDRTARLEAANKELEAFTYSVSHDLRAPLRIIDGYASILVSDSSGKLDEEGNRILGVIMSNAKRMGQLIDDLLNLSRLGRRELAMNKVDMNELLIPVLSELLSLNTRFPEINIARLDPADCDANLIRQVWGNLISNAIKYSSTRENPVIEIRSYKTETEVVYLVKDNGVGFDMQYADKLFGVFQRLHKISEFEGTGVGLALVQRVVLKHGGKVWAEAEPGKGASFYFSLPANNPANYSFNQN